MIDARTLLLLQTIFRRESRSLLQYVSEAFPWTTPQERDLLAKLQNLIAEERDGAAELADFLRRNRQMPGYLGAYPMSFTRMNFVSLESLLPLLLEQQRQGVARLEKDLAQVTDAEVRGEIQKVLDRKRRHLEGLQSLITAETPHSTVR